MKHLIIILAALVSFNAAADRIQMVCSQSVVELVFDDDNGLDGIVVDNVPYAKDPDVIRKVYNGELMTNFIATRGKADVIVTKREDGRLRAALYTGNKEVWGSPCRFAR